MTRTRSRGSGEKMNRQKPEVTRRESRRRSVQSGAQEQFGGALARGPPVGHGGHTGGAPPRGPLAQDGDRGAGEVAAAPAPAPAPARARAPEAAPPPAAPRLPEPLTPGAPSPGGGPGARTRRRRPKPGPMARADTGRGLLALTFCLLSARGKGPGGRSREWASPAPAMFARRGLWGLARRGCVCPCCVRACPPACGPCVCEVCVSVCRGGGVLRENVSTARA